jgi:hypothetical protein
VRYVMNSFEEIPPDVLSDHSLIANGAGVV